MAEQKRNMKKTLASEQNENVNGDIKKRQTQNAC